MKEFLGASILMPRSMPYREIFVSRIRGSVPGMAEHFYSGMLAMWEQDGITEILFEDPHSHEVQMFLSENHVAAEFEGETGIPYADWESGTPVTATHVAGFLISYSWERSEPDNCATRLVLDPGLAFGTGRHPSTQQSLALLRAVFSSGEPPARVVDLGCGTGILSVAAALLGAGRVTAVDYSLVAAHAARMNAALNNLESRIRVIHGDAFDNLRHPADLAVCNLTYPLIDRLLQLPGDTFAPLMIFSGIYGADRFHEVTDLCTRTGREIMTVQQQGPWFSCLTRTRDDTLKERC